MSYLLRKTRRSVAVALPTNTFNIASGAARRRCGPTLRSIPHWRGFTLFLRSDVSHLPLILLDQTTLSCPCCPLHPGFCRFSEPRRTLPRLEEAEGTTILITQPLLLNRLNPDRLVSAPGRDEAKDRSTRPIPFGQILLPHLPVPAGTKAAPCLWYIERKI